MNHNLKIDSRTATPMPDRFAVFCHHGDAAAYTGYSEEIFGGLFFEAEYLEGHRKGQFFKTARKPKHRNRAR